MRRDILEITLSALNLFRETAVMTLRSLTPTIMMLGSEIHWCCRSALKHRYPGAAGWCIERVVGRWIRAARVQRSLTRRPGLKLSWAVIART